MEERPVGATDLRLSVVGLGGAWLGHDPGDSSDVSRAVSVLRAAQEAGVNWVDTSENYFDTGNEAVIGLALREISGDMLVCSKVAPVAALSGGATGFRPEQVRRACEKSLQRLGREHLDMYLLHWPDDTGVPLADTWGAMAGLVTDGLVRSIGLSNYEREDISRCHEQHPVDALQTGLSLIDYLDDRDLIAWCGEQKIAVTIYEPLGSGILTDRPYDDVVRSWVGTPGRSQSSLNDCCHPSLPTARSAWSTAFAPSARRSVLRSPRSRSLGCCASRVLHRRLPDREMPIGSGRMPVRPRSSCPAPRRAPSTT